MNKRKKSQLICWWCGKNEDDCAYLIKASPTVLKNNLVNTVGESQGYVLIDAVACICEECVEICAGMIAAEIAKEKQKAGPLQRPRKNTRSKSSCAK